MREAGSREAGPTGDGRGALEPGRRADGDQRGGETGRRSGGPFWAQGAWYTKYCGEKQPTVSCSLRQGGRPGRSRQRPLYRVMPLPESGSVF